MDLASRKALEYLRSLQNKSRGHHQKKYLDQEHWWRDSWHLQKYMHFLMSRKSDLMLTYLQDPRFARSGQSETLINVWRQMKASEEDSKATKLALTTSNSSRSLNASNYLCETLNWRVISNRPEKVLDKGEMICNGKWRKKLKGRCIMGKKVIYMAKMAKPVAPYSRATLAGNLLFIAGTVATNDRGEVVGKGDIKTQTRQTLENIKAVIEAAGGTMRDVAKTTVFLTDFANFSGMNEVYSTYFPTDPPARATVRVDLVNPDFLIEIEATAVLG